MSRRLNWLWPVLVVVLFCAPLFYGLDHVDLRGDEAAHSFTVERILETGDWLIPRISPSDFPFLEKPPLKFWIVAAGIRSGLLPHSEVGLRFWDALFASGAFFYVFLIGRRLAGPLCGAAAVCILFVHGPLLLEHGLRDNDMEAALILCYCGGIYHYLVWTAADAARGRRHAGLVGLYFALGFMVKFVAALFLPIVLAVASLAVPAYRRALVRDWRVWGMVKLLVLVLVVPWYAYGYYRFGMDFWRTIFGAHVYTRLLGASGLDPSHVHPWNFYFAEMYTNLRRYDTWLLTLAGGVLLTVDTIRRRRAEGFVVVLWFALPMTVISAATSKLYHYAYPYLPPLALAGGYLIALAWEYGDPLVRRFLGEADAWARTRAPWLLAIRERPGLRGLLLGLSIASTILLGWTLFLGPVRISVGSVVLFKSGSILRPWIVAALCGVLAGAAAGIGRVIGMPLVILLLLPLPTYRASLDRLAIEAHPTRSVRDCIETVRATIPPASWHGVYVAGPDSAFGHGDFYYFRTLSGWVPLQNWVATPAPADETLYKYLYEAADQRPVLLARAMYGPFNNRLSAGEIAGATTDHARVPPTVVDLEQSVVLLPGPYARCGTRR